MDRKEKRVIFWIKSKDVKSTKTIKMDVKISTKVSRIKKQVALKLGLSSSLELRVGDLVLDDNRTVGDTSIAGKLVLAYSVM